MDHHRPPLVLGEHLQSRLQRAGGLDVLPHRKQSLAQQQHDRAVLRIVDQGMPPVLHGLLILARHGTRFHLGWHNRANSPIARSAARSAPRPSPSPDCCSRSKGMSTDKPGRGSRNRTHIHPSSTQTIGEPRRIAKTIAIAGPPPGIAQIKTEGRAIAKEIRTVAPIGGALRYVVLDHAAAAAAGWFSAAARNRPRLV